MMTYHKPLGTESADRQKLFIEYENRKRNAQREFETLLTYKTSVLVYIKQYKGVRCENGSETPSLGCQKSGSVIGCRRHTYLISQVVPPMYGKTDTESKGATGLRGSSG